MILVILLALLIGLSLGLLGGGGSILTIPILVYALGVEKKAAIASSLLIVGLTSAVAVLSHARGGTVQWRTGLLFGAAGMLGAYAGGQLSSLLPAAVLLSLFALFMVAAAVAMLRGRQIETGDEARPMEVSKALLAGVAVGVVTGLLGAGGGFLIVPALVLLGGLPMRQAIGTSLFVIAVNSFAGFLGHASHEAIDYRTTLIIAGVAALGALLGERLARHVSQERLRHAFAYFILLMAAFLLVEQVAG